MGVSCCKEVRTVTRNTSRIVTDGDLSIKWIKGNKIGEGMFSKVYEATNTTNGSLLAVKSIYLTSNREVSKKFINQINKEITILKKLHHPNIVKYYQMDLEIESNEVHLILEFLGEGNLTSFINRFHPLHESVIRRITKDILNALSYLHNQDIIHRDLKSANVLMSTENGGTAKLSDFGLSKISSPKRVITEVAGSPYWMAPEVLNEQGYAFSADIWSLGCTIIEMILGHPAWAKRCKTTRSLVQYLNDNENDLEIPNCSDNLKDLITLCLKRNPLERPTANQLLDHEFLNKNALQITEVNTILSEF